MFVQSKSPELKARSSYPHEFCHQVSPPQSLANRKRSKVFYLLECLLVCKLLTEHSKLLSSNTSVWCSLSHERELEGQFASSSKRYDLTSHTWNRIFTTSKGATKNLAIPPERPPARRFSRTVLSVKVPMRSTVSYVWSVFTPGSVSGNKKKQLNLTQVLYAHRTISAIIFLTTLLICRVLSLTFARCAGKVKG